MLEETTCNSIDEKVDKSTETKGLNNKEITQAIRLMNSLKTFCEKNKIPMFSVIAEVDSNDNATYIPRVVTPLVARRNVKNDKISKFNAAINGNFYLKVVDRQDYEMAEMADEFAVED